MNDFVVNGKASSKSVQRRIDKHLTPFFGGWRMASITATDVMNYVAHRQVQGIVNKKGERVADVSNAEVNRELAILKRIFNLAIWQEQLARRPKITMLKESAPRSGFFEADQIASVIAHLPADLQPVIAFAYHTGWRLASEVLPLEWRNVDLKAGEVRIDAGASKNGEGRVIYTSAALRKVLETQQQANDALKKAGHITPLVFWRMVAETRGGEKKPQPIVSLNKAWKKACRAAGLPGRIPHDLRRTAVRNFVRAGIPQNVAMAMTGHKTPSIFARYNITSGTDLREAAEKMNAAAAR